MDRMRSQHVPMLVSMRDGINAQQTRLATAGGRAGSIKGTPALQQSSNICGMNAILNAWACILGLRLNLEPRPRYSESLFQQARTKVEDAMEGGMPAADTIG